MRFILLLLIILMYGHAFSQGLMVYNMRMLPQRILANPSVIPEFKGFMGFPMISSMYSAADMGFSWSDVLVEKGDDSLYLDMDKLIGQLKETNYVNFKSSADYISLGIASGKGYLTFNASEKISFGFNYPRDLIELMWYGNAHSMGRELQLGVGINASSYTELAFGYARPVSENLIIGGKAKFLMGRANFWTSKNDLRFYTDPVTYEMTLSSDAKFYSSGAGIDVSNDFGFIMEVPTLGFNNPGFACDLAATYVFDDFIELSAGFSDVGFIHWKDSARSYTIESGEYIFDGIDLISFIDGSESDFDDQLDDIADTLKEIFDVKEQLESYTHPLQSTFFLNAGAALLPNGYASILLRGTFMQGHLYPTFTLGYYHKFFNAVGLSVNYSIVNNRYTNLGCGLSGRLGPLQVYIINDNILAVFDWQKASLVSVNFGINFIFGRKKNEFEESPRNDTEPEPVPVGN